MNKKNIIQIYATYRRLTLLFLFISFVDSRERGKEEEERNIDVRNIDWLPLACIPTGD